MILDIDETLVHVVRTHEKMKHQHILKVSREGFPTVDIKFNLRPGAREFLQDMSKCTNLALMTASHRSYADTMHTFLDPKKELLVGVFSKEHCINYTKGR